MPIIGMVIGESVAGGIGQKAKYIGIAVLVIMALYSLLRKDNGEDEASRAARAQGAKILFLAIALSLDNLTVGFGVGMFDAPLGLAAIVFGVISLLMTLAGLELGRFLGKRISVSPDKLSGVVLLLVAGVMAFV